MVRPANDRFSVDNQYQPHVSREGFTHPVDNSVDKRGFLVENTDLTWSESIHRFTDGV